MIDRKDNMKGIKVEIKLEDLMDLQETAKLYFLVIEERDQLQKRNIELINEIEKFKTGGAN